MSFANPKPNGVEINEQVIEEEEKEINEDEDVI